MLQNLLKNKFKIVAFLCLFGMLMAIRAFENELFYDPFLNYFKSENAIDYPNFDNLRLFSNLIFRYLLNSIISLAILFIIFSDIKIVKFSVLLYLIFLVVLLLVFYIIIHYFDESYKMILFYIRRFLIQPVLLLLFIPGFYYQNK
jgi:exosortase F-associated protein